VGADEEVSSLRTDLFLAMETHGSAFAVLRTAAGLAGRLQCEAVEVEGTMTTGTSCAADRGEELSLLSAVLSGDRRAGHRFFDCYKATIERSVRKVLGRGRGREEEVQDLCGEVWLSLLENDKRPLRRFDPSREIRVSTWISLLARNKAIDRVRGSHHRQHTSLDELGSSEPVCAEPLPSEQLEAEQQRDLAERALAELRGHDRRFLEAWYTGCSPEELARREGISIGTVYTRRFKIQAKLAKCARRLERSHRLARRRWPRPETVH
jgi:RNA polymerase sigma-70 factor (ECF subfamily)